MENHIVLQIWDFLHHYYLANPVNASPHQDVVSEERAQEVAKLIGAKGYFETSAKTNTGVNEVFEEAAKIVFEAVPKEKPERKCVII